MVFGNGKTRDRHHSGNRIVMKFRGSRENVPRATGGRCIGRLEMFRESRGNVTRATGRRSFGKLETKLQLGELSGDEGSVRRRKWKEGSKTRAGGQSGDGAVRLHARDTLGTSPVGERESEGRSSERRERKASGKRVLAV
jgi:hypothetical protein